MKNIARHLSCPNCGGALGVLDGERISTCPSCGTRSLVEIEDYMPRYVIDPELDMKAAKMAAMRLLSDSRLAPDIKKEARFYDAGLYYLPMYELTAQRVGKFVTRELTVEYDRYVENKKANVLMRDIQFQAPAIKLGEWGLEHIKLEKLRQVKPMRPFDSAKLEKEAHVFDSTIPPDATELAADRFKSSVPGDETKILQSNLRLVFCPVWLIKYTYRNRLYRLVIDAVTGNVLFGRAPARDTERIPIMVGVVALLTYPVARFARLFITGTIEEITAAFILAAVPIMIVLSLIVFFLAMAWNQFRYSGEVVWRGEQVDVERVNKPPETSMEKLARVMSSIWESTMEDVNIGMERGNRWYGPW